MSYLFSLAFLYLCLQKSLIANEFSFTPKDLKTLPIITQQWCNPPFTIQEDQDDKDRLRVSATLQGSENEVPIGHKTYHLLNITITLKKGNYKNSPFARHNKQSTTLSFLESNKVRKLIPCGLLEFPALAHQDEILSFFQFFEEFQESYTINFIEQTA